MKFVDFFLILGCLMPISFYILCRYFVHRFPRQARVLVIKFASFENICLFYPLLLFGKKSLYTYSNSRGGKLVARFPYFWKINYIYIFGLLVYER